jgi:hypothetical protein
MLPVLHSYPPSWVCSATGTDEVPSEELAMWMLANLYDNITQNRSSSCAADIAHLRSRIAEAAIVFSLRERLETSFVASSHRLYKGSRPCRNFGEGLE